MISTSWARGFASAKAASAHSDATKTAKRMGASIYLGSTIKAVGFNQIQTTHPAARYGIHAEQKALLKRQYYNDRSGIMYVYRETADGKPALSRPCQRCMELIRESGAIERVRFINEHGAYEEIKL